MDEEPRLRHEDSALGEAIRGAQAVGPTDAERNKIAAGLGAILGSPFSGGGLPAVPEATTGATTATGAALVKWAVAACLVGGAVWWGLPQAGPDLSLAAASTTAPVEAPVEVPAVEVPALEALAAPVVEAPAAVELPAFVEVDETLGNTLAANAPSRERTPRSTPRVRGSGSESESESGSGSATSAVEPIAAASPESEAVQEPDEESRPSELGLLAEARRVLRSTPAQTLRLTNQHRDRFDRGALVEEREVLAIEALVRLSRRSQAEARAERFRRSYPRSIHTTRVSAILVR
jgi:hypothetical protein